jgi:hypothetical protein
MNEWPSVDVNMAASNWTNITLAEQQDLVAYTQLRADPDYRGERDRHFRDLFQNRRAACLRHVNYLRDTSIPTEQKTAAELRELGAFAYTRHSEYAAMLTNLHAQPDLDAKEIIRVVEEHARAVTDLERYAAELDLSTRRLERYTNLINVHLADAETYDKYLHTIDTSPWNRIAVDA